MIAATAITGLSIPLGMARSLPAMLSGLGFGFGASKVHPNG
jgi:hypothetical protein